MSERGQRVAALIVSTLLAMAGAVAGVAGIPAPMHQIAEIVLAIGGALGTALLPGVRLPPKEGDK